MKTTRKTKDVLYGQAARIGKAVSSPKRLEIIDLLCQGEKSVEALAEEAAVSMKLASAHLRALRLANLVATARRGKHIYYRLVDPSVAGFWVAIHSLAENRLVEVQATLKNPTAEPQHQLPYDRDTLLHLAKRGDVVVLDVRPVEEYLAAHFPFARSIPLAELHRRLDELPKNKQIVTYCRGPYCLMAQDAVRQLRREGYDAVRVADGVAEWGLTPGA